METIKKKDIEDISPKIQDLITQFFFLFFQFSLKNFPKIIINNNNNKPSNDV